MIAWLSGILLEKNPPNMVINVGGVGYVLETSLTTFFKLPSRGEALSIYVQTIVREDAFLLFGFYSEEERLMFQYLLKVNGIGPKLALGILSSVDPQTLATCIREQDLGRLVKLPGVGKKTAERLLIEMQDKLKDWAQEPGSTSATHDQSLVLGHNPKVKEAMQALLALGYKTHEASRALKSLNSENKTSETLLREALRYLMPVC